MASIRIDALSGTALPSVNHEFPAMKDGIAVKLTVQQVIDLVRAVILDGSPEALNTLNKLAAAMGDDANFAATVTTALGARYTKTEIDAAKFIAGGYETTFSDAEKLQARENIGAGSALLQSYDAAALSGVSQILYDLPAEYRLFEIKCAGLRSTGNGNILVRFGSTAGGAVDTGASDYIMTFTQSVAGAAPTGGLIFDSSIYLGGTFSTQWGHQCISVDKGDANTQANVTSIMNSATDSEEIISLRGGRRVSAGERNRLGLVFTLPLLASGFIKIYGVA